MPVERFGAYIPVMAEICFEISAPSVVSVPLANSAVMNTLTTHCQWGTVREKTGHLPLYAEAKKMKSLTLHTNGCHMATSETALLFRGSNTLRTYHLLHVEC